ncbi:MAG TPA: hypothetical protein DIU40_07685, partial [Ruminococcaceae bacterium]|nr:hypothetical protein [Oscillospiraceae bacterium]
KKTVRGTVLQRVGSFQVRLSAASKETSCFYEFFAKFIKNTAFLSPFPKKLRFSGAPMRDAYHLCLFLFIGKCKT